MAPAPGLGGEPQCEVELTEVRTRGQDWWTLGFEATGPASQLRSALQATAALIFAQALPGDVEPGPDESRSYAEWLCLRPGADSDADAPHPFGSTDLELDLPKSIEHNSELGTKEQ